MEQGVRLVTRDATLDDLSLSDYRDMIQELRCSLSLEKLIAVLNSQYSKPLWAKVEKGEAAPNRNQRNELRRYYGMPLLPPTVAEATAAASPDAAVWQVGEGVPDCVIMVTGHEPLTLHVNGAVSVADPAAQMAQNAHVTAVTGKGRTPAQYDAIKARRAAQSARCAALGVTRDEAIEAGLKALEEAQP